MDTVEEERLISIRIKTGEGCRQGQRGGVGGWGQAREGHSRALSASQCVRFAIIETVAGA